MPNLKNGWRVARKVTKQEAASKLTNFTKKATIELADEIRPYKDLMNEILGKDAGSYSPKQMQSLIKEKGWQSAEDSKTFWQELKQGIEQQKNTTLGSTVSNDATSAVFEPIESNAKDMRSLRGIVKQTPYELEMQATEAASVQYGTMTAEEAARDQMARLDIERGRQLGFNKPVTLEQAGLLQANEFNYNDPRLANLFGNKENAWSSTAKAVLGTAVVGAGICAALSSSRGQQSNAQLYGQQPLY